MENNATAVVWRRLAYTLTPQLDIYAHLAPHIAGKRVLEVGFGTGAGALQYVSAAKSVTAIEVDASAVKFAKTAFPIAGIEWRHEGIADHAGEYDAVVMVEVLEHIHDWEGALAAVRALLVPDGRFYLSHRNASADLRKNDLHEREWTAQELEANLLRFFDRVTLYNYSLSETLDASARATPLVAVSE